MIYTVKWNFHIFASADRIRRSAKQKDVAIIARSSLGGACN